MISRTVNSKKRNEFFVSDNVHPQTLEVMQTRAKHFGMKIIVGDWKSTDFASMKNLCGALVQYPDTTGTIEDYSELAKALHKNKAHLVVSADPLALCQLRPPSEFGADVVVGTTQRFGVPMWFGGPHGAYLATSLKQVRRMPGRIIGESLDRLGDPAFRLTLQTREQHIRLDKATSNVCTAQVLLANMAAMYAVFHGTEGIKRIAARVHALAQVFINELAKFGVPVAETENFFDTVCVHAGLNAQAIAKQLAEQALNVRQLDDEWLSVSFDESHTEQDVYALAAALKASGLTGSGASPVEVNGKPPAAFARTKPFLQQRIFNSI